MASVSRPIRILLADDHPIVCDGLAAIIDRQPDMLVVAQAANGREAVELFRTHRPDITLMDLRMPVMRGVEATDIICKEFPGSRVIVLTTYDGDEEIYQALRSGARGYLLKDMYREDLLAAIRAVHDGQRRIPPHVAKRLAERMEGAELTERELDVLRLLVKGESNKQIGTVLQITEGTVKGHINSILGKLGVEHRAQAVRVALKRGLVHIE